MSTPMENLFMPRSIRTVSGLYVNVFEPKPEMFCIEDIAHALSMQPRFGGHLPKFYSVAQHSVNVAFRLMKMGCDCEIRFAGLMHDASEAYLLDVPRPIKTELTNYKAIEDKLMRCLADVFGFAYPLVPEIKEADEAALNYEWQYAMLNNLTGESSAQAKSDFLNAYNFLKR